MYDTMDAANGVGLATQPDRLQPAALRLHCAADLAARRRGVVINPVLETSEIPETMPDPDTDDEGCLSVPGSHFLPDAPVTRSADSTPMAAPVSIEAPACSRGAAARAGHLDGFLYLDRLIGRYALAPNGRQVTWRGRSRTSWLPGRTPTVRSLLVVAGAWDTE